MKVVVLGSKGLIGKALCKKLISLNIPFDEFDILNNESQDLRKGGVFDKYYDYCFFLACDVGGIKYLEKKKNQIQMLKNNLRIYINVFEKLEKNKIPFLFASSQLQQQQSGYGSIKRLGEQYTKLLGGQIVRFWNVYGYEPIGEKSHVISDFIYQALTKNKIVCRSNGLEKRQFLYDRDCANGLIAIMNNTNLKLVDLTVNKWISIKEVISLITKQLNAKVVFGNKDYQEYKYINPSHNEINRIWVSHYSLEDGIKEMIGLYKEEIKNG